MTTGDSKVIFITTLIGHTCPWKQQSDRDATEEDQDRHKRR